MFLDSTAQWYNSSTVFPIDMLDRYLKASMFL